MNNKIIAITFSLIIIICIFNITGQANNTASSEDLIDYHAVIVGISDYNGSVNDLPSPAYESEMIESTLTEHGWNSSNIRHMVNDQATRKNILDNLSWLGEQDGTVLFYFIGHGTQVKDLDGDEKEKIFNRDEAICPWELTSGSLILDDELKTILNSFKAEKTVCIFGSCFSGGLMEENDNVAKPKTIFTRLIDHFPILSRLFSKPIFRNLIHENTISIASEDDYAMYQPMDELQGENRIIMTAVQENKEAYEFVFMGQPFCVLMRQALGGGILDDSKPDTNGDNYVSVEEAFDYTLPRAILENAMGFHASLVIIIMIRSWINGIATLFDVLSVCAIYGLVIPIPQIYDSDTNQEIILTELK